MQTRQWLTFFGSLGLTLAVAVPLWAQRGDDDDRGYRRDREGRDEDRGERGERGDRRERRFDPTELLKRMDANGNGQLEPGEVSDRARGFVERAASQAGLDPKQPLAIDKLSAAMQRRDEGESRPGEGEAKSETPAASPMTTPAPTSPAPSSSESTTKPANPPLVPGFGVETKFTPPPGFGTPAPSAKEDSSRRSYSGSSRSGSSSSGSRGGSSGGGDNREAAAKVRRYAEGLLKQYDENKNGVLEKDEWKKMRGDPEKADRNDDDMITLDELADRLANYGSDGGSSSSSSSNSSGRDDRDRDRGSSDRGGERYGGDRSRSRSDRDTAASDKKSYRYLTPTERLPKGLPTWFTRNDADADGQVTMAEYSTSYNETTVAEFNKYDLDSDGIITPGECLEAEQLKTAKK